MMKKILLALFILLFATNCFAQEVIKDANKQLYCTTLGSDNDEVIIGDPNSPDTFKPEIKFQKWKIPQTGEYENSLTIKPLFDIPNALTTLSGNKIEYKGDKIGWYANPDPDNSDNLKFGLILYEKPATNVFTFVLEGWEEFDFFYQPPLKNLNPDGSTWEDNGHGGKLYQPANVVGSYAIYHKNKRDHLLGQTNYGCGKFGHFYNILFTDAIGKTERVYPDIKDGLYIVNPSWDFLNSAIYPVKANDTFGETGLGTSDDSGNKNVFMAWKSNSNPSSSGTLTAMTSAMYSTDGGAYGKMALYAHVATGNGYPGNLIANSATGAILASRTTPPTSDTATWLTGATGSASIVSGTQYWHCSNTEGDTMHFMLDDNTGNSYEWGGAGDYYTDFPDATAPDVTVKYRDHRYSIYATYTPAGGAGGFTEPIINIF